MCQIFLLFQFPSLGAGLLDGALNTGSGGLISSDPFNFRNKLSEEDKEWFDAAVRVGQVAQLLVPGGAKEVPSLQPVNGPPIVVPTTLSPIFVPTTTSNQSGSGQNNKKSASDEQLIKEAQEAKAKEQKARERQQNRQTATKQGKQEEGNSNQNVRGEHDNTKGGGGNAKRNDHENANARRAREQKAADKKKQGG